MKNRTALLTGAYGAIGKAIARGLAKANYRLVMVGRDEAKLKELELSLNESSPDEYISYHVMDLSSKKAIEAFAQRWQGPLHLLINNAVAAPRTRQENDQGVELQFATNVLGYFHMMELFHPYMENLDDARIVNVGSHWAGDLDLDDLEFTRRQYNNDTAYRQSKQADRMLTEAFARRLQSKNIAVLATHPGNVRSKVSSDLGYGGSDTPEEGAKTPLFCALDPTLRGATGKYYENMREVHCPFMADRRAVDQLYEICRKY